MTPRAYSTIKTVAIGVAIPILTAVLLAAVSQTWAQKLDVTRFERDSITNLYINQRRDAALFRVDSGVRRIEARLDGLTVRPR